ncbi:hypothetical protein GCM10027563_19010 [Parasphingorhabdus pacifica]
MSPAELDSLDGATTFGRFDDAPSDPAPQAPTDGVVLRIEQDVPLYDSPSGRPFARLPAVQLDNPTWVPMIEERGQWARVLLPSRPNGATGWLRTGEGAPVHKAKSPYFVDVDLDAYRLQVHEGDQVIGEWTVGIGKPGAPTPRGRTFIMASIEEKVTRFSPIILPLGAHSDTFDTYGGGPGTVALHGWPNADVFGTESSDGCVRVPDEALRMLTSLPLGTVVRVR